MNSRKYEEFKNWVNSTFKSTEEMAAVYDFGDLEPRWYVDFMEVSGGEEGMEEYRRVKPAVDQQSTLKSVPSVTDESNRECNQTEREPDETGREEDEIESEEDDESIDNENHNQYNISCDDVRQEITIFLKIKRKTTVVRFLRKIGDVNPSSFARFMKMEGPNRGYNNLTFWGSVRYFYLEGKRKREGKPALRVREGMSEAEVQHIIDMKRVQRHKQRRFVKQVINNRRRQFVIPWTRKKESQNQQQIIITTTTTEEQEEQQRSEEELRDGDDHTTQETEDQPEEESEEEEVEEEDGQPARKIRRIDSPDSFSFFDSSFSSTNTPATSDTCTTTVSHSTSGSETTTRTGTTIDSSFSCSFTQETRCSSSVSSSFPIFSPSGEEETLEPFSSWPSPLSSTLKTPKTVRFTPSPMILSSSSGATTEVSSSSFSAGTPISPEEMNMRTMISTTITPASISSSSSSSSSFSPAETTTTSMRGLKPVLSSSKEKKAEVEELLAILATKTITNWSYRSTRVVLPFNDCDQVRAGIKQFLKEHQGGISLKRFAQAIGLTAPPVKKFLEKKGPKAGLESDVYQAAHRFLEVHRVYQSDKQDELDRLEREATRRTFAGKELRRRKTNS
jgi:hypothetical protein